MISQNKDTRYRPVKVVVWDEFGGKSSNNPKLGTIGTKNAGLYVEVKVTGGKRCREEKAHSSPPRS